MHILSNNLYTIYDIKIYLYVNYLMKMQYLSDLHIELMHKNNFKILCYKIVPKCDILVLAGDIGNPLHQNYKSFLQLVGDKFKKVFLVMGNHEYYKNDIVKANDHVREICSSRSNLSFWIIPRNYMMEFVL